MRGKQDPFSYTVVYINVTWFRVGHVGFLISCPASDELKDAARVWIDKLSVKNGYPPDSYPNPGELSCHSLGSLRYR